MNWAALLIALVPAVIGMLVILIDYALSDKDC